MASGVNAFKQRVSEFNDRVKKLFGAKAQGYDELSTLETPLVGVEDQDEDSRAQAGAGYRPPAVGGAARPEADRSFTAVQAVPSQAEELRELSVLARDAAEILWEMAAMGETGAAVYDMRSKAEQLQAQLRGIISDYQGGDEALFAQAFESFDMLSRCLEEQKNPGQPAQVAPTDVAAVGVSPPAARPAAVEDQPLISFD